MFELPCRGVINDIEYPINTDWKTWAEIGELLKNMNSPENVSRVLILCFKGEKIPQFKEGFEFILDFYRRGKKAKESNKNEKPVFDLVYDFGLVSAAFLRAYKIDLRNSNLHWWEFWELFEALTGEEKIIKVIGYRSCNLNEIKSKEEKKHIQKMKELYKLPEEKRVLSEEEIAFELDKLF